MAAYFQASNRSNSVPSLPVAVAQPPADNAGTILAVTGAGFTVVAGDTRRAEGFGPNAPVKFVPTVFRLTDKAVLATNGFAADGNIFIKKVRQRLDWYRHAHAKDMSLHAIARLIQSMLYQRRFCPFYVYNILGGIEDDGMHLGSRCLEIPLMRRDNRRNRRSVFLRRGWLVHPRDMPYRRVRVDARPAIFGQSGTSSRKPHCPPTPGSPTHLPLPRVLALVVEAFAKSAATPQLAAQVGDGLEIYIVLAKGTSAQGIDPTPGAGVGVAELTSVPGGERIFLIRRALR
ncbi:N-terminal nucleophile aminohydrolases [Mycena kentingensis (nom. inval.)]|nr:N-terminal nucleophile aminohydrolases [Mycena kentingensis (nom. inval.)]